MLSVIGIVEEDIGPIIEVSFKKELRFYQNGYVRVNTEIIISLLLKAVDYQRFII